LLSYLPAINHAVLLALLLLHGLLGSYCTWQIVEHLRLRHRAITEERRLLEREVPKGSAPHILVQVPTFNEGRLLLRAANVLAALDWPREKLHVQILDDSTEPTSRSLAQTAVQSLVTHGIDAVLLQRSHRDGFKAGALGYGLARSDHPFVAVLDADYVPPPRFLNACMVPMLAEPNLALVQGRCDFLNAEENVLTRVQQRMLDEHFVVEQATRSWTGQVLPFNGTCGVWRRAAIDEAGGWHADTLSEDVDLSYRVQLRGWRARYLVTLAVPGELPDNLAAWRTQQIRWSAGLTGAGRKLQLDLWCSRLPLTKKIIAQLHLSSTVLVAVGVIDIALYVVDVEFGVGFTWLTLLGLVAVQLQEKGGSVVTTLLAQQTGRGANLWSELAFLPVVAGVALYRLLLSLRGLFEGLVRRSAAFVRTPKKGA